MTNRIHPTAVIGDGVELGNGNVIGPYTVVCGPAVIGDGNWIGPHVTIGTPAENRDGPHPVGWEGELAGAGVRIGSGNTIREFVGVHQGYERPTVVGDRCYLLARSHVAHDCVVEDEVTMTSSVQLAGHCHVWAYANLGLGAVVHQRTAIGPGAMVGMGAVVLRDVGAFTVTVGNPARPKGINEVGLARRGCDEPTVQALRPLLAGEVPLRVDGLPAAVPGDVAGVLRRWASRPG